MHASLHACRWCYINTVVYIAFACVHAFVCLFVCLFACIKIIQRQSLMHADEKKQQYPRKTSFASCMQTAMGLLMKKEFLWQTKTELRYPNPNAKTSSKYAHPINACMRCMHACGVSMHAVYACMRCMHVCGVCMHAVCACGGCMHACLWCIYVCIHACAVCTRCMSVCLHEVYQCMHACMHALYVCMHACACLLGFWGWYWFVAFLLILFFVFVCFRMQMLEKHTKLHEKYKATKNQ